MSVLDKINLELSDQWTMNNVHMFILLHTNIKSTKVIHSQI